MSADEFLARLEGVKSTGPDRWIAKCPSHKDRKASLSVRVLDDGRVLVHDFAGCSVEDVLAAVGLEFDSLYPERSAEHRVRRHRQPFDAVSVLRSLPTELAIIVTYTSDMRAGRAPSHADHDRFLLACSRIVEAEGYSRHA